MPAKTPPIDVSKATSWELVEPVLLALASREVADADAARAWLEERGETDAAISEAGDLLYIHMTCDTSNEDAASAYRAYLEGFVPKLKPLAFALDR